MGEYSEEYKAQYSRNYGPAYSAQEPDYSRCAEMVYDRFRSDQCSRKAGHGPHGAWCKQHDPIAVKAKVDAKHSKWEESWAAERRQSAFAKGCQDAIRQIAAGHNDPRGLAQSLIDKLEGK